MAGSYIPRMKAQYDKEIKSALQEKFSYSSPMAIPKIEKIIVNMRVGEATMDKSVLDAALEELTTLAAQKAVKVYAKKSVSNFKLREGMAIGAMVTLRGPQMYDFFDKIVTVTLPRVRDFQGLKTSSFDGRGNFSFGLKEQIVFPEINYDKINKVRGMDITLVTTAKSDEEAMELLRLMGMPFTKKA